jgi:hypothetical protein
MHTGPKQFNEIKGRLGGGKLRKPTIESADVNQQVEDTTSNAVGGLILCIIQVNPGIT